MTNQLPLQCKIFYLFHNYIKLRHPDYQYNFDNQKAEEMRLTLTYFHNYNIIFNFPGVLRNEQSISVYHILD